MPRIFRHYVPYRLLALAALEACVVFASVFAGLRLSRLVLEPIPPGPGPGLPKAVALSVIVLALFYICDFYDLRRAYGRGEIGLKVCLALAGAYLVMAAVGYLSAALRLERIAYAFSFVVSLTMLLGTRLIFEHVAQSSRHRRRLLLLGSGRAAEVIAHAVNGSNPNYELLGCVDGQPERIGREVNGVKILGTVQDLPRLSRTVRPDLIVVALAERRHSLPLAAILECKLRGIEVQDWPNFYEKLTRKIHLTELRPSWLVFSDGFAKGNFTPAVKRTLDILMAAVGLALSLPLFPLIAVLIKLDSPGRVVYRQERVGRGGEVFWLLKFRSMRLDAETDTGPVWADAHDPRVTRVGRLLRRSRLDELPQLINVLRGEMSLVGPRPERPAFVAELQEKVPFYTYRLAVKPGLTGWAQVNYRYGCTIADALEKLEYDFYYIKNLSIFLDLVIVLQTVQVVLLGKGSR
jgi:sugar transferase (PEP-CTERM system associated)